MIVACYNLFVKIQAERVLIEIQSEAVSSWQPIMLNAYTKHLVFLRGV